MQGDYPCIVETLALERKRLEATIATKKKELQEAIQALEQFDKDNHDIRTITPLV